MSRIERAWLNVFQESLQDRAPFVRCHFGLDRSTQLTGRNMKSLIMVGALALGALGTAFAQRAAAQADVQEVIKKELGDLPGKEGLLLRVSYPPGSSDQVHRHDAHGFVYVQEGSGVIQVPCGQPFTLQ